MDERLHQLHLQAGQVCGREKTCGKKTAYLSEEEAGRAAAGHNRWAGRKHDVEPYPCAFCGQWHVGGVMPVVLLEAIVGQAGEQAES